MGEYELNGHGYEIKEEKENGIIIENPGTNKSKYIKYSRKYMEKSKRRNGWVFISNQRCDSRTQYSSIRIR